MLAFLEIKIQEKKKDCEEEKKEETKSNEESSSNPFSASFQSNGKNDISINI